MYCIHVLFELFVSRALIQGVMGYKYRISIDEVSTKYRNYFIYFLIPIFRYSTDTVLVVYRGIEVSHMYSDTDTATRCRIGVS
jgi:hypothetical protein